MTLRELLDSRAQHVAQMRAIKEKAEAEKRDMTPDENVEFDKIFDETEKLRGDIEKVERAERLLKLEAESRAARGNLPPAGGAGDPAANEGERRMRAFRTYLTGGFGAMSGEELRDLQVDNPAQAGYLVAPQQFVMELIKFVDNLVYIRSKATKFQVPRAVSLGAPTYDTDPADADWTTELGSGSADTAMAFGKRELRPHPFAKRVKISNMLLMQSMLPIETFVMQRLGYKFGVTEEKAFMLGSGAQQPLGLFTASADGIPTTQDVSTGNQTTVITFDGLIECKFSLKPQYHSRAEWIFHRDAVKMLTKIKDGDGQYIWQQAVTQGQPDMLLGRPLTMSEYCPNTFTTGKYVGIFGDLSQYWIADALDMQVQKLVELYAESRQTGFIGVQSCDGMPVLAEAFARVKLA